MSAITAYCPKRKRIKILIKLFKRSGSLRRLSLREIPLNFAPTSKTLAWRLRMEKILMEDNDKDECFQYIELHKIKEKSKQKVDEINELITIKEWDIMGGDWESKFDEYAEDIKKKLEIAEIRLKKLKVSEEILEDIKHEYLNGSQ